MGMSLLRALRSAACVTLVGAVAWGAAAEAGQPKGQATLSEQAVTTACRLSLNKYYVRTDAADWTVINEVFTHDAEVTLRDGTYNGTDELIAYFEARDPAPNIIHHLTSTMFHITGEQTAKGTVYILIQGSSAPDESDGNRNERGLMYSGIYSDEYVIEDGVCRISKRVLRPRFLHHF